MIKNYLPLFLFFLSLIFSCKQEPAKNASSTAIQKPVPKSSLSVSQKKILAQQIDSVFAKTQFNGSVSVRQNGEKIYEKINGFRDFDAETKLDSNAVFAVGSISKQFTAVLILLLEEQGKLRVEEPVSHFLPEFQPAVFRKITIHQLLTHTSGISDSGTGLLSEPGTRFHYSNKGYRYLGKIVEKASGKSYDGNAAELFAKAGLKNTFTATSFSGENFAGAYLGTPEKFKKIANMPKRLAQDAISLGAGGILASFPDLHRWNAALYGGKILKPESLHKFLEKYTETEHAVLGKTGYGYGIMSSVEKPISYFHTGYVKGSPSLNIYYPKTKTSVVILSNIADDRKGKNGFFLTHKNIKKVTDSLQTLLLK